MLVFLAVAAHLWLNSGSAPREVVEYYHKGVEYVTNIKDTLNENPTVRSVITYVTNLLSKSSTPTPAAQTQARQVPSVALNIVESVSLATERDYIGRVEAVQTVQLKPQVAGQIAEVHFKEGSIVKAGQLLFSIDNRQYQATVDLRKADLAKATANYDRALKYRDRLKTADKRSVSASDLDIAESDVLQGKAGVDLAKASLKLAQIDLDHTKVTAPIAGRIGAAFFTKGNYVTPTGVQPLAVIVQVDPIRVVFALSDRDYLDAYALFKSSEDVYNAKILLSNGVEYPFTGNRDFEDNAMNEHTGTMTVRLSFENKEGELIPGAMVRVRTRPASAHVAIVIPQEAILADAQGDYVYIVDTENVTRQRRVSLGAEEGATREVVSGLSEGERVVVYGLQSIRPEMKVNPK
ncbi:MexE family multidrug efflux RND transporter periplasmic adaptor subunit [Synergistales bacterium]|nr:MexE family multidrug efflux RND transporter periplasmic adaptor subunit [Synergistales bacterium]